jgi:hypothetical protein
MKKKKDIEEFKEKIKQSKKELKKLEEQLME